MAVEEEVVQKSGAWFSFGEVRLGQGRENAKTFIRENEDLFDEIKKLVMEKKGVVPVGEAPPDENSDGDDESE
jgi:recombination protein RecA